MLVVKGVDDDDVRPKGSHSGVRQILKDMFLPAGYPTSVSPDYTRYQIYNALQAFCSALAGLISARAVLEGFGVGNASASATNAILVGVMQDVCSRVTTIFGAYFFGTSLFPEAKTYRFLADVLNDLAIALDVLSPYFNTLNSLSDIPAHTGTLLRIVALCTSSCCRALCGMAAGGSKAALTLHFTNGPGGTADVGDLNAKDGSKETVLALIGVLFGSVLVPRLSTPQSTYVALAVLLAGHLYTNYQAVCGVCVRSLNRQRASISWQLYIRRADNQAEQPAYIDSREVACRERILCQPDHIFEASSGRRLMQCTFLSSPAKLFHHCHLPYNKAGQSLIIDDQKIQNLVNVFAPEKYIVWYPDMSVTLSRPPRRLFITMKPGYTVRDMLKAWIVATSCARSLATSTSSWTTDTRLAVIEIAQKQVEKHFNDFGVALERSGWDFKNGLLFPRMPSPVDITASEYKSAS